MTKEELKALGLTDEQSDKVVEDYGKNYVSKGQFNEKNEELKTLKGTIKERDTQLEDLKKSAGNTEELQKKITTLQEANKQKDEAHEAQIKQMQIDSIVEKSLGAAKVKNAKAVKPLLDLTKAELDGESIKGLDEQIKKLQESDAYLFGDTQKIDGFKPKAGGDKGQPKTVQQEFEQSLGL